MKANYHSKPKARHRLTFERQLGQPFTEHIDQFMEAVVPVKERSMVDFALEEIVYPTGPMAGLPFSFTLMPWLRAVYDRIDEGQYRRFVATGAVQSGKTLHFVIVPCLYHLFETNDDVILAAPTTELAFSIYKDRILPVIQRTKYADFLPKTGAGSSGGQRTAYQFSNGASIRFMGAGGGDGSRASHTARVAIITEVEKMGRTSVKETHPFGQIEARTAAYGDKARIYIESTLTDDQGVIWSELQQSTGTHVMLTCPHCDQHIFPERSCLTGFESAEGIKEAVDNTHFFCSSCGVAWSEQDRRSALEHAILQDERDSNTFGVRWTAVHSGLVKVSDIAEKEYRARCLDTEAAERELCQYVWAVPYKPKATSAPQLSAEAIRQRSNQHEMAIVPQDVTHLVLGMDIGTRSSCHWTLLGVAPGWTNGYVVEYGVLEIPRNGLSSEEQSLVNALQGFRDSVIMRGWERQDGTTVIPQLVMLDSGYLTNVVYEFCMMSDHRRFKPITGEGSKKGLNPFRNIKPGPTVQVGNAWYSRLFSERGMWLTHINVDHWKQVVHRRLVTPVSAAGNLTLHKPPAGQDGRFHHSYAKHLVSEQWVQEYVDGQLVEKFVVINRNNHWLDSVTYAAAGVDMIGGRLKVASAADKPKQVVKKKVAKARPSGKLNIAAGF